MVTKGGTWLDSPPLELIFMVGTNHVMSSFLHQMRPFGLQDDFFSIEVVTRSLLKITELSGKKTNDSKSIFQVAAALVFHDFDNAP